MAVALTSATGVLSLLQEPDDALKSHALKKVDEIVDQFWAEIAGSISTMYVPPYWHSSAICPQKSFLCVCLT